MSRARLAGFLLLAAAGCYSDSPPQSTFPEPQYVSGPPGGTMDPDFAVGPEVPGTTHVVSGGGVAMAPVPGAPGGGVAPADDEASDEASDDASDNGAAAGPPPPGIAAPDPGAPGPTDLATGPAEPPGDDGAPGMEGAPVAPPSDPMASVSDVEIDATLEGYGQWIETDDYGQVWRPDATVVGVNFTPYESAGSWAYTDAGWAFSCDYSWGWLPFHYGRWAWFQDYWAWVPGHRWGPAWVEWRHGGGVVGWRPSPPRVRDHRGGHVHGGTTVIRDHRRARQHDAHWRFAAVSDFARPHVRAHLYGNLAEGLRVTARVAAPPLRARTAVRAGDLMRSRFVAASTPGTRFLGPAQVRDHRSAVPGTGRPAQALGQPIYSPPVRTFQPPTYRPPQGYRPPVRTLQPSQTYRPPVQSQPAPPPQGYRPPVRTFQPSQTYRPPAGTFQPSQGYRPPVRTFQPSQTYRPPAGTFQPSQGYRPSVRTFQPSQTYRPPAGTFQPAAPPIRPQPFQPPRTFQPAAPTIAPRPSAPPAHTTQPARSFGSPAPSGVRSGRRER